jgi:hypothetical protein
VINASSLIDNCRRASNKVIAKFKSFREAIAAAARHPIPDYTRPALYVQAVFIVLCLLVCQLQIIPLIPGVAIDLLAIATVVISFRLVYHVSKPEQFVWIAIAFGLIGVELGVTYNDRAQNEKEKAQIRIEEATTRNEQNKSFAALLAEEQKLFDQQTRLANQTIDEMTGGDTFPKIDPAAPAGSREYSLMLMAVGKHSLLDVTVTVHSHTQRTDPESIMRWFTSPTTTFVPLVLRYSPVWLPLTIHPEDDEDKFQIYVSARNGSFLEMLTMRRDGERWRPEYKILDSRGRVILERPQKKSSR